MTPKIVLSKEEADRVAVAYSPRRFPMVIQQNARDFVAFRNSKPEGQEPSFRIDKIIAEQTGVAELERMSIEEKVEREALSRVKELQEQAYQEAYQLGFDEGRETAFAERKDELIRSFDQLSALLASMERLKTDLIASNEAQILRLAFAMVKRIVMKEIAVQPDVVIEVMRQAVANAQSEENITIRVSQEDFAFIENAKGKLGKDFEFLQKARLEASDDISSGGCVVETNYGVVNATVEQRLDKIWSVFAEKLPRVAHGIDGEAARTPTDDDNGGDGGGAGPQGG